MYVEGIYRSGRTALCVSKRELRAEGIQEWSIPRPLLCRRTCQDQ